LREIQRRSEAGRDLNCFLSKKLLDAHFQDKLLFDWGIHHFHLNVALEASGFSVRSDRLLFARVTEDVLYFIAIGDHQSWADEQLVENLHRNWPDTMRPFRLNGVLAPTQRITQEERAALRQSGIQTFVHTKDDTIYGPIGGGYATDGSSVRVTQDLITLRHYFGELKRIVREDRDRISKRAWSAGINPDTLRLRLVYDGEKPFAQDDAARLRIRLPPFAAQQGDEADRP